VRLDGLLPVGYFLKSLSSGSTNLLAEPLRVTASGAPDIQLTLTDQPPGGSPVRRVSGRVTGVPSDLLPASLGLVILTAQDTEDAGAARSSQTSVGANGVFEFARVPRGRYRLEVIGGLARQVTLGLDNTAASITVDSADVEIELPLLRGGVEVRGNVAVRDGAAWAALRGISFEVAGAPESAPNRRLAVTHVAPNGGFRVWLAPGAYTVKTDQCCQPENVVVDSVVSGSVDLRQAPLKVGTAPVDPIIVTVKPDPSRRR
jgi:hypothetical protein